jgi:hypothetical protein
MSDRNRINSLLVLIAVFGISAIAYFSTHDSSSNQVTDTSNIVVNIKRNQTSSQPVSIISNPVLTAAPIYPQTTPAPKPNKLPEIPQAPTPTQSILSYSSSVSYRVPGNQQSLSLNLTVNNNIITAVSVNLSKTGGESAGYQSRFESSYKNLVLGKNIKSVSLSRVGGASLTTNAFMQALNSIKNRL